MAEETHVYTAQFKAEGVQQILAAMGEMGTAFSDVFEALNRLSRVDPINIGEFKGAASFGRAQEAFENLATAHARTNEEIIASDKKLAKEQETNSAKAEAEAERRRQIGIRNAENVVNSRLASLGQDINRQLGEFEKLGTQIGLGRQAQTSAIPYAPVKGFATPQEDKLFQQAQDAERQMLNAQQAKAAAVEKGLTSQTQLNNLDEQVYRAESRMNQALDKMAAIREKEVDDEARLADELRSNMLAADARRIADQESAGLAKREAEERRQRVKDLEAAYGGKAVSGDNEAGRILEEMRADMRAVDARRQADQESAALAKQEADARRQRVKDLEAAFGVKPGSALYSQENAVSQERLNEILQPKYNTGDTSAVGRLNRSNVTLNQNLASINAEIERKSTELSAGLVERVAGEHALEALVFRQTAIEADITKNTELLNIALNERAKTEETAARQAGQTWLQQKRGEFALGFKGERDLSYAQQIGQAAKFSVFYGTAYKVLFAFTQTLQATLTEGIAFQQGMTDLAVATGRTKEELDGVGESLARTAAETGASPSQGPQIAARAIGIFGASSSSLEDQARVGEITNRVVSRMAIGSGKQPIDLLGSLGAIAQALNLGVGGTIRIADLDAYMTKRFGAPQGSTLDTVAQSASAGKAAGFSDEDLFAIAANIIGKTGQSPSAVGGFLAQLFTRGGEGQLLSTAQRVGVDTSGKDLSHVLIELAHQYQGGSAQQQQLIAASVGRGKSQNAIVGGFFSSIDEIQAASRDAKRLASGAADKQFDERMKDIGGRLNALSGSLKLLAHELGETGLLDVLGIVVIALKGLADATNDILATFNLIPRPIKDAIVGFGAVAAALAIFEKVVAARAAARAGLEAVLGATSAAPIVATPAVTAAAAGEVAGAGTAVAAEVAAAGTTIAAEVSAAGLAIAADAAAARAAGVAVTAASVDAAATAMGVSTSGLALASEQRLIAEAAFDRNIAAAAVERLTTDQAVAAAEAEAAAAIALAGSEMAASFQFLATTFGVAAEAGAATAATRVAADEAAAAAIAAGGIRIASAAEIAANSILVGGSTIAAAEETAAAEIAAAGTAGAAGAAGAGAARTGALGLIGGKLGSVLGGKVGAFGALAGLAYGFGSLVQSSSKSADANRLAEGQISSKDAPDNESTSSRFRTQADALNEIAKQARSATGLGAQLITFGHANDASIAQAKALEAEAKRLKSVADEIDRNDHGNTDPSSRIDVTDPQGIAPGLAQIATQGGSAVVQMQALTEAIFGLGKAATDTRGKIIVGKLATGVEDDLTSGLGNYTFDSYTPPGGGPGGGKNRPIAGKNIKDLVRRQLSGKVLQDRLKEQLDKLGVDDLSELGPEQITEIAKNLSNIDYSKGGFKGLLSDAGKRELQRLLQMNVEAALNKATGLYQDAINATTPLTAGQATGAAEELGKAVDARTNLRPKVDYNGRLKDARTKLRGYRALRRNALTNDPGGDFSQLDLDIRDAQAGIVQIQIDNLEAQRKAAVANAKTQREATRKGRSFVRREISAIVHNGGNADQLAAVLAAAGKGAVAIAEAEINKALKVALAANQMNQMLTQAAGILAASLGGPFGQVLAVAGVVAGMQDPTIQNLTGLLAGAQNVVPDTNADKIPKDPAATKEQKETAEERAAARRAAEAARRGGDIEPARAAVASALAELHKAKKGTVEYYNALASYYQAKDQLNEALRSYRHIVRELHIDTTDPLAEANLALQTAREKLREDIRRGKARDVTAQDKLDVKNAQNEQESTAFSQRLDDVQTAEDLGRISHAAYMRYLESEHNRLNAIAHRTRQQQDQLNQVDKLMKDAAGEMAGAFNIGDIKLPTPYEVRRYIKTQVTSTPYALGPNATSGTTTIYINGADTGAVKRIIDQNVGKGTRVLTTTTRRN